MGSRAHQSTRMECAPPATSEPAAWAASNLDSGHTAQPPPLGAPVALVSTLSELSIPTFMHHQLPLPAGFPSFPLRFAH